MSLQPEPFRQRWPWLGPDLQTLRDTLRPEPLPTDQGLRVPIPLPDGDRLLALEDRPPAGAERRGLVVLVHGLAGDSSRQGVRRLGLLLQEAGFTVWRLNLRGAGPGRPLARGSYAAACSADLLPVLAQARVASAGRPLLAVGLSLGGTVVLNALLERPRAVDGLVCVSSPLDLMACSRQIGAPRNVLYQRWLLHRLIAQTLADPFGLAPAERRRLLGPDRPRSIRAFDAAITAPRWGYRSVEHYYAAASPAAALLDRALPPALLVHAADDPWVPVAATRQLAHALSHGLDPLPWQVWITARGGHNGFHGGASGLAPSAQGPGPRPLAASWADRQVLGWLRALVQQLIA